MACNSHAPVARATFPSHVYFIRLSSFEAEFAIRIAADIDFPITVLSAQPGQELTLGASPTSFFFNATDMALPNDVSSFSGQPRLELVFPF